MSEKRGRADADGAENSALLRCHHCGERFADGGTRILADVRVTSDAGAPRVEQIALHELCVPDDRYLRYRWENMRIERLRER